MKNKILVRLTALLLAVALLLPTMLASASDDVRYVVTGDHKALNMRAGMSVDELVITSIPYGAPVTLLGLCDDPEWSSVYYGEYNGYVMTRYLSEQRPAVDIGTSDERPDYSTFAQTDYAATVVPASADASVYLYWEPSTDSDVHSVYAQGDALRVIAETAAWAQVLDEKTMVCGYVLKKHLQ